jgi:hypothetical protein
MRTLIETFETPEIIALLICYTLGLIWVSAVLAAAFWAISGV